MQSYKKLFVALLKGLNIVYLSTVSTLASGEVQITYLVEF